MLEPEIEAQRLHVVIGFLDDTQRLSSPCEIANPVWLFLLGVDIFLVIS